MLALWMGLSSVAPHVAAALPVAGSAQRIGSSVVWRDSDDPAVFYYVPGELRIAQRRDGGVEATFFVVRYLGTTLGGDAERAFVRSSFTADVEMIPPTAATLADVVTELRRAHAGPVRVLPMPIQRIKTRLVFASAAAGAGQPVTFSDGFLEPAGAEPSTAFWRRRTFTLHLASVDAQILLAALRAGGAVMSLAYEFTSRSVEAADGPQTPAVEQTVVAGTLPLSFDAARFPDRLVLLDIAASSPPGYPVLSVYCYDFSEQVDPDLFEKAVEIEGVGLGGGRVATSVTFTSEAPDVTKRSVRFPFPVRLDRPFRQLVSETYWSGEERRATWSAPLEWTSVLDITASR
jgi:hypothetical protein